MWLSIFFKKKDEGWAVTVTFVHYLTMLPDFLFIIRSQGDNIEDFDTFDVHNMIQRKTQQMFPWKL